MKNNISKNQLKDVKGGEKVFIADSIFTACGWDFISCEPVYVKTINGVEYRVSYEYSDSLGAGGWVDLDLLPEGALTSH